MYAAKTQRKHPKELRVGGLGLGGRGEVGGREPGHCGFLHKTGKALFFQPRHST